MKIIKQGLDMSAYVVDMQCALCLTGWEASADPKQSEAYVYDGGDIPVLGEDRQLRACGACPNCSVQTNQMVSLRKTETL